MKGRFSTHAALYTSGIDGRIVQTAEGTDMGVLLIQTAFAHARDSHALALCAGRTDMRLLDSALDARERMNRVYKAALRANEE